MRKHLLAAALLCAGAATPALAIGIVAVAVNPAGTPDTLVVAGGIAHEIRSEGAILAPAALNGNVATLGYRYAWSNSARILPAAAPAVLNLGGYAGYTVSVHVDDPNLRGYTLAVDSILRGYMTTEWKPASAAGTSVASANGTWSGTFSDGTSTRNVTILDTFQTSTATSASPFDNQLISATNHLHTERYEGSRWFTVDLGGNDANFGMNSIFVPGSVGESDFRFGLAPTSANFLNAGYPGVDGDAADALGHFLNFTVTYDPLPVPEPPALALWSLGALWLGLRRLHAARHASADRRELQL